MTGGCVDRAAVGLDAVLTLASIHSTLAFAEVYAQVNFEDEPPPP